MSGIFKVEIETRDFVTQSDIDHCHRMIDHYLEKVEEYRGKLATCTPRQRGGYRSQLVQRSKDLSRWYSNLDHQMEWLRQNNHELYQANIPNYVPAKCPQCQSDNWCCTVDNADEAIFRCDNCGHAQAYDKEANE